MKEFRTSIKYKDQDYTICVDDDTRIAIDDMIRYQKSHPERTTVTIEPKLRPLRPYVVQKKSRFGRIRDWFLDPRNSEAVFAIGLLIMLTLVGFGVISIVYQIKSHSERHMSESKTEKSMSPDKPSYEVIEFK